MEAPVITQAFLRSVLRYNRRTGIFTWLERADVRPQWNGRYAGKRAGSEWSPDGGKNKYIVIRLLDWPFMAHRLAILYVTGRWPRREVDHKDLDGINNRWLNLRRATKAQNGANRGANKNSKTGIKGVTKVGRRYRATIQSEGHWQQVGSFATEAEAQAAYAAAAARLHGKFARTAA